MAPAHPHAILVAVYPALFYKDFFYYCGAMALAILLASLSAHKITKKCRFFLCLCLTLSSHIATLILWPNRTLLICHVSLFFQDWWLKFGEVNRNYIAFHRWNQIIQSRSILNMMNSMNCFSMTLDDAYLLFGMNFKNCSHESNHIILNPKSHAHGSITRPVCWLVCQLVVSSTLSFLGSDPEGDDVL